MSIGPAASAATPVAPAGYTLHGFPSVGSTNDAALDMARDGAPDRTVVWTSLQTGGRGRRGRPWTAPEGNLAVSILLRPQATPSAAAQLSFATALAVYDTVAPYLPPAMPIRLKWPNDVLVDGRKISGILLEGSGDGRPGLAWLVIGTGINLIAHPEGTETPATDVAAMTGETVAPATALTAYLSAFDHWHREWLAGGFPPLRDAWRARAQDIGRPVRVRLPREELTGRFIDLDVDGSLVLETAPGVERRIAAGDVFPLAA